VGRRLGLPGRDAFSSGKRAVMAKTLEQLEDDWYGAFDLLFRASLSGSGLLWNDRASWSYRRYYRAKAALRDYKADQAQKAQA
jgi:hypothetical protein